MKYGDLHIHSTFSDGELSPFEIVEKAQLAGLSVISITDHDTMAGNKEAREATENAGIEYIRGVEISTKSFDTRLHILGYYCSPIAEPLKSTLMKIRRKRANRLEEMANKLREKGIEIDLSKIESKIGQSLGRPHLANLLVEGGFAYSYYNAFEKFIGFGCDAYVEKWAPDPFDVIDMIHAAGGIAVIAHPGMVGEECNAMIPDMVDAGLDGIEAFHPSHNEKTTLFYRNLANQYGLVITGGSDFHSMSSPKNHLGLYKVKMSYVEALRNRHRSKSTVLNHS
jgi:predicted metal-dependent phosphoesterase TrpH